MALLDWILVAFGVVIGITGSWIQLHPEHIYPSSAQNWRLDQGALSQIRILGGCFVFMGVFFALQMTTDLVGLPWWIGTISGLVFAGGAVSRIRKQTARQQIGRQQTRREQTGDEQIARQQTGREQTGREQTSHQQQRGLRRPIQQDRLPAKMLELR